MRMAVRRLSSSHSTVGHERCPRRFVESYYHAVSYFCLLESFTRCSLLVMILFLCLPTNCLPRLFFNSPGGERLPSPSPMGWVGLNSLYAGGNIGSAQADADMTSLHRTLTPRLITSFLVICSAGALGRPAVSGSLSLVHRPTFRSDDRVRFTIYLRFV